VQPWIAVAAATGVIFAAFYMLPMVQRTVFNALTNRSNATIPDLNAREIGTLLPLVAIILWLGVYPQPVLERVEPAVTRLVNYMEAYSESQGNLAAEQGAGPTVAATSR
jgi:NADH-quinone oxidoreductase subunit M